jgi:hypothetical protein
MVRKSLKPCTFSYGKSSRQFFVVMDVIIRKAYDGDVGSFIVMKDSLTMFFCC